MPDEARIVISSEPSLGVEEIARRTFGNSWRGYDAGEVRAFLKRVADELHVARERERELHRRVEEIERERHKPPPLDEATLTNALGEETARVLRSAREAANDLVTKAEQKVARLVQEAHDDAARLREEASTVLARRTEEAAELVASMQQEAAAEIEAERAHGQEAAAAELESARSRGREMLGEAQALRERVLSDLARRRRLAQAQIEQLRAGRDRLMEAYRIVRRTLEEVSEELINAEVEARAAAEAAGRRVAAEPEATVEQLDAELRSEAEPLPAAPLPTEPERVVESGPVAEGETESGAETEAESEPRPEATRGNGHAAHEEGPPALRILRRPPARGVGEPAELVVLEPPQADEGVRVISAERAGDAEAPPADPAPVDHAPSPERSQEVDQLFARMKAERETAVASATRVLADPAPAPAPAADVEVADDADDAVAPPPDDASTITTTDDERALQRRDELLEPVEAAIVRRLKRVLQNDQNALLESLRTARGPLSAEAVLPPVDDHVSGVREEVTPLLQQAAEAGALFASGKPTTGAGIAAPADALARELVLPMRERLVSGIHDAAAHDDADHTAAVDAVNATYREWKQHRLEPEARGAVLRVFAVAAFVATAPGTQLRWVVDDDGGSCPDCHDDALAGPVARGEAFPTGQLHPPVHPGCRCLLIPVRQ